MKTLTNIDCIKDFKISKIDKDIDYLQLSFKDLDSIPPLYRDEIKLFIRELKQNIPKLSLQKLYFNLKNNFNLDEYIHENIYHKLLHDSTMIKIEDTEFMGFYQKISNREIGRGLNEGYTDLLNKRYYEKNGAKLMDCNLVMNIANILELLFGREKMTNWYFDSNLFEFNNALRKYFIREDAIKFYCLMDYVFMNYGKFGKIIETNLCYKELLRMLVKMCKIKLNDIKNNNTYQSYTLYNYYRLEILGLYSRKFIKNHAPYCGFNNKELKEFFLYFDEINLEQCKSLKKL